MKSRDIALLSAPLVLALGALLYFFRGPADDAPIDVLPPGMETEKPAEVRTPRALGGDAVVERPAVAAPSAAERPVRELPPDAEFGLIDGELLLHGAILDQMESYRVLLEEQRNDPSGRGAPHTWRHVFKTNPDGPQWFEIPNVPFSDHPYKVTVLSPGMNGMSRTVYVTEQRPIAKVSLSLIEAGPFTLRITDQFHNPLPDKLVELRPTGIGRIAVSQQTDSFGSAVFPVLVAGDYEVFLDSIYRDLITVDPPGNVRDPLRAGTASALLQIPVGSSLRIELADRVNRAAIGVPVRLTKVDTRENRRVERETDNIGQVLFEHLEPGTYQIDVRDDAFQPTSRRVEVLSLEQAEQPVQAVTIRVTPR